MKTPEPIFSEKYHDAVPRPTTEEWKALSLSIKEDGLRESIIINPKGVILDGYTRYEICRIHKIKPHFITKRFKNNDEELKYVLQVNAIRRQLNPFQRVELNIHIFRQYRKVGHQILSCHKLSTTERYGSLKKYSELVGVGTTRVNQAIKIIESDNERLKQQCRDGTMMIQTAFRILTDAPSDTIRSDRFPSVRAMSKYFENTPVKDELEKIIEMYRCQTKSIPSR